MRQPYTIPAATLEQELEIKKSRFIACAARVGERREAMAFVDAVKQLHPDASHYCWAYLLGSPESAGTAATNDDGEPSGTAGKPILHVIQHKNIGDVMVVVVRYFGGIKLGAGGLIRAYSGACEKVLSVLPLKLHQTLLQRVVRCDFSMEQSLRHWSSLNEAKVVCVGYDNRVNLELELSHDALLELEAFCRSHNVILLPGG